jgi:hypothetical protein
MFSFYYFHHEQTFSITFWRCLLTCYDKYMLGKIYTLSLRLQRAGNKLLILILSADDGDNGEASACGRVLIFLSWCMIVLTMPFSLLVCFKVSNFSFLIMIMLKANNKEDRNSLLSFPSNNFHTQKTARDF